MRTWHGGESSHGQLALKVSGRLKIPPKAEENGLEISQRRTSDGIHPKVISDGNLLTGRRWDEVCESW